jgi:large subunit ribosomal protein L1
VVLGGLDSMVDKKKLSAALNAALEDKGKRKFTQSVELIVNMRGIDFSKSENRLNLDIMLPKGKGGKELKIGVIAEDAIGNEAKKAGADLVIPPGEIPSWAAKEKITDLADNYVLLAQPNQMGAVAKSLGQYLGPRGKLPNPIVGNVGQMIERAKKSVRIVSKGKYLPTAQVFVGTEVMEAADLQENIEAVYDSIKSKMSESNIKSIYIKLSMGKPARVG